MARPPHPSPDDTVAYYGEVWRDGRGDATVRLPSEASPLEPPLGYEVRDLDRRSARVTAELHNGRLPIAIGQRRVKVAWRTNRQKEESK